MTGPHRTLMQIVQTAWANSVDAVNAVGETAGLYTTDSKTLASKAQTQCDDEAPGEPIAAVYKPHSGGILEA